MPLDNKEDKNLHYGEKVDVWAVGVLACELMSGLMPFSGSCIQEMLDKIVGMKPEIPR